MPRPSVRTIASLVGVSAATVSRVLNDRPGVSEELRAKVLEGMREHALVAPAPVTEPFVGIIVPELDNPIFPVLAGAIEAKLGGHGVTALIGSSTAKGPTELDYISTLVRRGIQGLVLISGRHANPAADHGFYWQLYQRRIPMVLVGGHVPDLPVSTVTTDEAAGAAMAVAHLRELGHVRIGLAGGQGYLRPSQNRLMGYRREMRRSFGSVVDALHVESDYSLTGGHAAARRLLAAGATAVIAGSDLMALGAVAGVREAGLRVPDDVSVVGYDDSYLAAHGDPPLTTVQQPIEQMASAVATAMWQRLQGYHAPHVDHVFTPRLVVRASTARPPARGAAHETAAHETAAHETGGVGHGGAGA
ncbi:MULTISPECIES: LacI family DNA-binding transcriptional regulator [Streptosporangium]|uniref:Alanine racemase n=1 Tax=Streptosporangium brasiliense TaxID=47480 RepID=A0ABT9R1V4_9ACTN|nr:substrate-binding domain-containing protein [Streptosporangium brasiliense]MDP9863204.1 alanine racemase [Streptosporangium brasiliense]